MGQSYYDLLCMSPTQAGEGQEPAENVRNLTAGLLFREKHNPQVAVCRHVELGRCCNILER